MKLVSFIGLSALVNIFSFSIPLAQAEMATAASPLSGYVGKYVYEEIDGTGFLHHPQVRTAIEAAVPAGEARDILYTEDAVVTPIIKVGDKLLYTRGFDPASGGDVNWGVLIAVDGSVAAVCYSQFTDKNYTEASWYTNGEKAFSLSLMCPSEAGEISTSFGDWPVGSIPG